MGNLKRLLGVGLVASLAACSNPRPDSKICIPTTRIASAIAARNTALSKPAVEPGEVQTALSVYAEQCVRRWSYRLAPSKEPLDVLFKLALAACSQEIVAAASLPARAPGGCASCQTRDELSERMSEQAKLALVQARIGDCRAGDNAADEAQEPVPRIRINFSTPKVEAPAA